MADGRRSQLQAAQKLGRDGSAEPGYGHLRDGLIRAALAQAELVTAREFGTAGYTYYDFDAVASSDGRRVGKNG